MREWDAHVWMWKGRGKYAFQQAGNDVGFLDTFCGSN